MSARHTCFKTMLTTSVLLLVGCSSSGKAPDNTSPVITLTGDDPQVMAVGEAYAELGATASDNRDGDLTASIVINASAIDSSVPGTYQVTYDVSDAAGNAATTVTRIVTVELTVPAEPTVSVTGDIKTLNFSWSELEYVDYFRMLENADGHSGFIQVGDDIPAGTMIVSRDIAGHLFDWVNAQYVIEACNVMGCSSSDVITATDVMLDTIGYFKSSNTDVGDSFGSAVAISEDSRTMAVGARSEDSAATGVNGDQANDSATDSGAVYVFTRGTSGWSQSAYIKASNTGAGDRFGSAIALSDDGSALLVGAPGEASGAMTIGVGEDDDSHAGAGAAYLFEYDSGQWLQQAYFKGSMPSGDNGKEPNFGHAVDLTSDGRVAIIGAPSEDNCNEIGRINNTQCVDGGAVYVFAEENGEWLQQSYIGYDGFKEHFGVAVSVSNDGNRIAIGASRWVRSQRDQEGAALIYEYDGTNWARTKMLPPTAKAGYSEYSSAADNLVISADGNTVVMNIHYSVIGATLPGGGIGEVSNDSILVFHFNDGDWVEQAGVRRPNEFEGQDDNFGSSIAMSADGRTVVVGSSYEQSAAPGVDADASDNSLARAGAAYVYRENFGVWEITSYIKASNPDSLDFFGRSMALGANGTTLAIGATGESSQVTGIDGDVFDNSSVDSGAVYVY